jgi:hypothetical protein
MGREERNTSIQGLQLIKLLISGSLSMDDNEVTCSRGLGVVAGILQSIKEVVQDSISVAVGQHIVAPIVEIFEEESQEGLVGEVILSAGFG